LTYDEAVRGRDGPARSGAGAYLASRGLDSVPRRLPAQSAENV